jgi:beta-glucosidase
MTQPFSGFYLPSKFAVGDDGQEPFRAHFEEILNSYAIAGATQLRLGFDWSQLQPRAGGLDGKWVEWYRDVVNAANGVGIQVWASLLEREAPHWFDDERGFSDAKNAGRYWPRFVEMAADSFGDLVAGWFPIDDPIGYATRHEPDDATRHGEMVDTMIVAWRDAWRILRGGPPVASSFGVRMVRPTDESQIAIDLAKREDHIRWKTFLRGIRDGNIVIPGRADRELADLAGSIDLVGITFRSDLGEDQAITDDSLRRWQERATMLIHRANNESPDRPIVISYRSARRGVSETVSDAEVLTEAFERAVVASVSDGINIQHVFTNPPRDKKN